MGIFIKTFILIWSAAVGVRPGLSSRRTHGPSPRRAREAGVVSERWSLLPGRGGRAALSAVLCSANVPPLLCIYVTVSLLESLRPAAISLAGCRERQIGAFNSVPPTGAWGSFALGNFISVVGLSARLLFC